MTEALWALQQGASVQPDGVKFSWWAPRLRNAKVVIEGDSPRTIDLNFSGDGQVSGFAEGLRAGEDYMLMLAGGRRIPDPVSRWQPHGVHGPSRVVDPSVFYWTDRPWRGLPLKDLLLYELHTGTFTPEGTFESIVPKLPYLRDLGITAVELMPVAEFPGGRNWGYDGVGLYAPQSTYGGPAGLRTLIDACHRSGLAVVLDVVYNHVGPEGNYLSEFGPFFTDAYRSPWGEAINFDGPDSDGVRRFFIDNALYWLTEFHIDALRLDAIHAIFDFGAHHILEELAAAVHAQAERLGRQAWVIAESDLNDPRVIRPRHLGGYGVDAQWSDDFHHSLLTALTGETRGYLGDYDGLPSMSKAIADGFVYHGQYSRYRRRRHGASSKDRPGEQFVVFTQNHDQIANTLQGVRLAGRLSPPQQKLAAAILLFSPFLPLLFMGQEYGETAGFHYFTDHGDPDLIEAVRKGRREEIGAFLAGEFVDPQDASTFALCKLNWDLPGQTPHAGILAWHRDCLALRKQEPCLSNCRKDLVKVNSGDGKWLTLERRDPSGSRALLVCNFSEDGLAVPMPSPGDAWTLRLWSGDARYGDALPEPSPGDDMTVRMAPFAAALYLAGAD